MIETSEPPITRFERKWEFMAWVGIMLLSILILVPIMMTYAEATISLAFFVMGVIAWYNIYSAWRSHNVSRNS